jgi:hypothetical protein
MCRALPTASDWCKIKALFDSAKRCEGVFTRGAALQFVKKLEYPENTE